MLVRLYIRACDGGQARDWVRLTIGALQNQFDEEIECVEAKAGKRVELNWAGQYKYVTRLRSIVIQETTEKNSYKSKTVWECSSTPFWECPVNIYFFEFGSDRFTPLRSLWPRISDKKVKANNNEKKYEDGMGVAGLKGATHAWIPTASNSI